MVGLAKIGRLKYVLRDVAQSNELPTYFAWVLFSRNSRNIMVKLFGFAVLTASLFAAMGQVQFSQAGDCCPKPVCCVPPPPVEISWCVEDPCTCCKYSVTACLPCCCKCESPCLVGWKPGILGRKVLTYKFPCGECVDVVITKHGKTIVRD